jgi:hypothetical protein
MICKCNKLIFGLLVGILLPPLTSYAIYALRYEGDYGFIAFIQGLMSLKSLGMLISISVLPNLAVFMLVVTFEKLLVARGLVMATFFWLLVVIVVRFIL